MAANVLMLFDAELAYTPAELITIRDFVNAGNCLFLVGENPDAFNRLSNNLVLAPYGIQFNSLNPPNNLTMFNPHPLTAGLTNVTTVFGGALDVSGPGTGILARHPSGDIGYAFGLDGQVVVLGDSNALDNDRLIAGSNNERLAGNLLDFFATQGHTIPEPGTLGLLSVGTVGLFGYAWRRRKQARS